MTLVEKRCPECGGGGWVYNASTPYGRSCRTCKRGKDKLREAAPDLLAALKAMVEIGYTHEDGCHPSEDKHTDGCIAKQAALNQARAAIRKAEGE